MNNPEEDCVDKLKEVPHKELVVGAEVAPSTGTPHLHVYISLVKKVRLAHMKELLPTAHWEPVRSRKECIEYCTKDGDVLVNEVEQVPSNVSLSEMIDYTLHEGFAGVARVFPYQYCLHAKGIRDLQYALVADIEKKQP